MGIALSLPVLGTLAFVEARDSSLAGKQGLLHNTLAARVDVARKAQAGHAVDLTPQPAPTRRSCEHSAAQDLGGLINGSTSKTCRKHLVKYYCDLVAEAHEYSACSKLRDETTKLDYFECLPGDRRKFPSECTISTTTSSRKKKKNAFSLVSQKAVRIAFLLIAHRVPGSSVVHLLRQMYDPANLYLVHIDKKSSHAKKEVDAVIATDRMVSASTFSEVNVTQGGNDLLRISVLGLQRLLKHDEALGAQQRWRYFVKLSEYDYPIASIASLQEFLWVHDGLNFVGMDGCHRNTCTRVLGTSCEGQVFTFMSKLHMHKPLPTGLRFARGPEWVALTRELSSYISNGLQERGSVVRAIWRDALLLYQPDETFFHTVIMNSGFCSQHTNAILHFIGQVQQDRKLHGPHDEIGTRSPAFLSLEDWEQLSSAKRTVGSKFFARKFEDLVGSDTAELRSRLESMGSGVRGTRPTVKGGWSELEDWLRDHASAWVAAAAESSTDTGSTFGPYVEVGHSGSCSEQVDDSTGRCIAESTKHSTILGRLPVARTTEEDAAVELRYSPEAWLFGSNHAATDTPRELIAHALVEKFAVPPQRRRDGAGSPWALNLLMLRIGTSWNQRAGRYHGSVNVVPQRSCTGAKAPGISLATYWALGSVSAVQLEDTTRVEAEWVRPDQLACGRSSNSLGEVHLSGPPLMLQFPQTCDCTNASQGVWSVRVRARLPRKQDAQSAASGHKIVELGRREFAMYKNIGELSLQDMQKFFALEKRQLQ